MTKKIFLSLLIILMFSFNCIGQNIKSNLVKLDTKEMDIDKDIFDVEVIEIERNKNISKLKIIDKTLTSVCSVITLEMMAIYRIAKLTNYKYFVDLENYDLEDGNRIIIIGFTNEKNAGIKSEFGLQYSNKDKEGEKKFLISIHSLEVIGIRDSSFKKTHKKRKQQ